MNAQWFTDVTFSFLVSVKLKDILLLLEDIYYAHHNGSDNTLLEIECLLLTLALLILEHTFRFSNIIHSFANFTHSIIKECIL